MLGAFVMVCLLFLRDCLCPSKQSESDIFAKVRFANGPGNEKTKRYDNGDVYYGELNYMNQRHADFGSAYGTYTYANGSEYVGPFKNERANGYGITTYASGAKYVGQYKNDKRHGHGTYTGANGTILHSGKWKNGEPS